MALMLMPMCDRAQAIFVDHARGSILLQTMDSFLVTGMWKLPNVMQNLTQR